MGGGGCAFWSEDIILGVDVGVWICVHIIIHNIIHNSVGGCVWIQEHGVGVPAWICLYTYKCTHACMHVDIGVRMCIYVDVDVGACNLCAYTHVHMYTHNIWMGGWEVWRAYIHNMLGVDVGLWIVCIII